MIHPKALNSARYSIELTIDEKPEQLPVVIRRHPASRRMTIRYRPVQHVVCVTLPRYVSIRQGLHFAETKRGWIERQVRAHGQRVPFSDGQVIPLFGLPHAISHAGGRGVVRAEEGRLLIPGEAAFMPRRVREWIKATTRDEIAKLAEIKAESLGKTVRRVSVRDTHSRWGSCSHDGRLSFSWRLAFAPREVLDYIVCHEVAHLCELNHSPAFWAVVAQLCPAHEQSQRWLKAHGATLYNYG